MIEIPVDSTNSILDSLEIIPTLIDSANKIYEQDKH